MPWKTRPSHGHLKGHARSHGSGATMDGATVTLAGSEQRQATTDATGFYGFVDLAPGQYTVVCEATGFISVTNSITVTPGKPMNLEVALKPAE
jgi:hypothetical protein